MSAPDEVEQRLTAKAGAGDFTVPAYAHSLVEEALRAGATSKQVREVTDKNTHWPS